jgi:hypothetical protein
MPVRKNKKLTRRKAIEIGALWKQLADSGMSEREIIVLQFDQKRSDLAKLFEVGESRVGQIVAKAKRKMRHPVRRKLCLALGLKNKVDLDKESPILKSLVITRDARKTESG